jgi:hypothetical protein
MFEIFSDMYFVLYKLYYVDQNDNLDIRVSLRNWDGGSTCYLAIEWILYIFTFEKTLEWYS